MGGVSKSLKKLVGGSSKKKVVETVAPEVAPQIAGAVGADSAADLELERQRKRVASGKGDTILTGSLGDTTAAQTARRRTLG